MHLFPLILHFYGYYFCSSLCSGAAIIAKCLTNLAYKFHRLRNVCSSLPAVAAGHLVIASVFYGSIDMVEFLQGVQDTAVLLNQMHSFYILF